MTSNKLIQDTQKSVIAVQELLSRTDLINFERHIKELLRNASSIQKVKTKSKNPVTIESCDELLATISACVSELQTRNGIHKQLLALEERSREVNVLIRNGYEQNSKSSLTEAENQLDKIIQELDKVDSVHERKKRLNSTLKKYKYKLRSLSKQDLEVLQKCEKDLHNIQLEATRDDKNVEELRRRLMEILDHLNLLSFEVADPKDRTVEAKALANLLLENIRVGQYQHLTNSEMDKLMPREKIVSQKESRKSIAEDNALLERIMKVESIVTEVRKKIDSNENLEKFRSSLKNNQVEVERVRKSTNNHRIIAKCTAISSDINHCLNMIQQKTNDVAKKNDLQRKISILKTNLNDAISSRDVGSMKNIDEELADMPGDLQEVVELKGILHELLKDTVLEKLKSFEEKLSVYKYSIADFQGTKKDKKFQEIKQQLLETFYSLNQLRDEELQKRIDKLKNGYKMAVSELNSKAFENSLLMQEGMVVIRNIEKDIDEIRKSEHYEESMAKLNSFQDKLNNMDVGNETNTGKSGVVIKILMLKESLNTEEYKKIHDVLRKVENDILGYGSSVRDDEYDRIYESLASQERRLDQLEDYEVEFNICKNKIKKLKKILNDQLELHKISKTIIRIQEEIDDFNSSYTGANYRKIQDAIEQSYENLNSIDDQLESKTTLKQQLDTLSNVLEEKAANVHFDEIEKLRSKLSQYQSEMKSFQGDLGDEEYHRIVKKVEETKPEINNLLQDKADEYLDFVNDLLKRFDELCIRRSRIQPSLMEFDRIKAELIGLYSNIDNFKPENYEAILKKLMELLKRTEEIVTFNETEIVRNKIKLDKEISFMIETAAAKNSYFKENELRLAAILNMLDELRGDLDIIAKQIADENCVSIEVKLQRVQQELYNFDCNGFSRAVSKHKEISEYLSEVEMRFNLFIKQLEAERIVQQNIQDLKVRLGVFDGNDDSYYNLLRGSNELKNFIDANLYNKQELFKSDLKKVIRLIEAKRKMFEKNEENIHNSLTDIHVNVRNLNTRIKSDYDVLNVVEAKLEEQQHKFDKLETGKSEATTNLREAIEASFKETSRLLEERKAECQLKLTLIDLEELKTEINDIMLEIDKQDISLQTYDELQGLLLNILERINAISSKTLYSSNTIEDLQCFIEDKRTDISENIQECSFKLDKVRHLLGIKIKAGEELEEELKALEILENEIINFNENSEVVNKLDLLKKRSDKIKTYEDNSLEENKEKLLTRVSELKNVLTIKLLSIETEKRLVDFALELDALEQLIDRTDKTNESSIAHKIKQLKNQIQAIKGSINLETRLDVLENKFLNKTKQMEEKSKFVSVLMEEFKISVRNYGGGNSYANLKSEAATLRNKVHEIVFDKVFREAKENELNELLEIVEDKHKVYFEILKERVEVFRKSLIELRIDISNYDGDEFDEFVQRLNNAKQQLNELECEENNASVQEFYEILSSLEHALNKRSDCMKTLSDINKSLVLFEESLQNLDQKKIDAFSVLIDEVEDFDEIVVNKKTDIRIKLEGLSKKQLIESQIKQIENKVEKFNGDDSDGNVLYKLVAELELLISKANFEIAYQHRLSSIKQSISHKCESFNKKEMEIDKTLKDISVEITNLKKEIISRNRDAETLEKELLEKQRKFRKVDIGKNVTMKTDLEHDFENAFYNLELTCYEDELTRIMENIAEVKSKTEVLLTVTKSTITFADCDMLRDALFELQKKISCNESKDLVTKSRTVELEKEIENRKNKIIKEIQDCIADVEKLQLWLVSKSKFEEIQTSLLGTQNDLNNFSSYVELKKNLKSIGEDLLKIDTLADSALEEFKTALVSQINKLVVEIELREKDEINLDQIETELSSLQSKISQFKMCDENDIEETIRRLETKLDSTKVENERKIKLKSTLYEFMKQFSNKLEQEQAVELFNKSVENYDGSTASDTLEEQAEILIHENSTQIELLSILLETVKEKRNKFLDLEKDITENLTNINNNIISFVNEVNHFAGNEFDSFFELLNDIKKRHDGTNVGKTEQNILLKNDIMKALANLEQLIVKKADCMQIIFELKSSLNTIEALLDQTNGTEECEHINKNLENLENRTEALEEIDDVVLDQKHELHLLIQSLFVKCEIIERTKIIEKPNNHISNESDKKIDILLEELNEYEVMLKKINEDIAQCDDTIFDQSVSEMSDALSKLFTKVSCMDTLKNLQVSERKNMILAMIRSSTAALNTKADQNQIRRSCERNLKMLNELDGKIENLRKLLKDSNSLDQIQRKIEVITKTITQEDAEMTKTNLNELERKIQKLNYDAEIETLKFEIGHFSGSTEDQEYHRIYNRTEDILNKTKEPNEIVELQKLANLLTSKATKLNNDVNISRKMLNRIEKEIKMLESEIVVYKGTSVNDLYQTLNKKIIDYSVELSKIDCFADGSLKKQRRHLILILKSSQDMLQSKTMCNNSDIAMYEHIKKDIEIIEEQVVLYSGCRNEFIQNIITTARIKLETIDNSAVQQSEEIKELLKKIEYAEYLFSWKCENYEKIFKQLEDINSDLRKITDVDENMINLLLAHKKTLESLDYHTNIHLTAHRDTIYENIISLLRDLTTKEEKEVLVKIKSKIEKIAYDEGFSSKSDDGMKETITALNSLKMQLNECQISEESNLHDEKLKIANFLENTLTRAARSTTLKAIEGRLSTLEERVLSLDSTEDAEDIAAEISFIMRLLAPESEADEKRNQLIETSKQLSDRLRGTMCLLEEANFFINQKHLITSFKGTKEHEQYIKWNDSLQRLIARSSNLPVKQNLNSILNLLNQTVALNEAKLEANNIPLSHPNKSWFKLKEILHCINIMMLANENEDIIEQLNVYKSELNDMETYDIPEIVNGKTSLTEAINEIETGKNDGKFSGYKLLSIPSFYSDLESENSDLLDDLNQLENINRELSDEPGLLEKKTESINALETICNEIGVLQKAGENPSSDSINEIVLRARSIATYMDEDIEDLQKSIMDKLFEFN